MATDGTGYSVLHSFAGGVSDGNGPSDLILSDNTLYGMTGEGGADNRGTIYSFAISVPESSSLALLGAAVTALAAPAVRRVACIRKSIPYT